MTAADEASATGFADAGGTGVLDRDSLRRARIRLVPPAGTERSRGEADVRRSRVEAARARIAAGFYDRADVREKLLDAILEELTDR